MFALHTEKSIKCIKNCKLEPQSYSSSIIIYGATGCVIFILCSIKHKVPMRVLASLKGKMIHGLFTVILQVFLR